MGSQKKNNNIINKKSSNPKPMRRRSQSRRVLQINMAEARREIVQALQLHRSSLSSASATTTTTSAAVSVFGNSSQCCYYSLTESMPVPEPIWSTTAPAILPATAAAPQAAAMESLEFEWGESQAGAYSWWLGFLKTLDGKNNDVENSKYQQHLEKFVMGNSCKVFGYQDSSKPGEEHNSYPEEWLMIPTSSDDQTNT
ncbi:formin-F-like [Melia azedarach]|uniref:Formin-F-like n=1 Tax=Melia azedarach TaxID=155640 RepID=A0ACC1WYL1_MELAZ|nr:formin-F-like [Melia azedarach]